MEVADEFRLTITAKMKHTDLWEAAKRLGSVLKLAERIGVFYGTLIRWVGLKGYPKFRTSKNQERWQGIRDALLLETNKTIEELWPLELVHAIDERNLGRAIEITRTVSLLEIGDVMSKPLLALPSPDNVMIADRREAIEKLLSILPNRKRSILMRRMEGFTLEDVGREFGLSKDRVRQIVFTCIKKLRANAHLYGVDEDDIQLIDPKGT